MQRSDCFVSVVAPLTDDADLVDAFVDDVMGVLSAHYANYELVLVDDGSVDDTTARVDGCLLRYPGIRLLRLSRTFGLEAAISAGLDNVIGDYVAVMLPESDPADVLPAMVDRARAGSGVVYGVCHDRTGQPWLLRTGADLFFRIAPRWFGLTVTRDSTLFRVLSRQALNAVNRIRDNTRYFRLLTMVVGFHSEPFEYRPKLRRPKRRGTRLLQAAGLAISLVVTQSRVPLRVASLLALLSAVGNLVYVGYAVAIYAFMPHVQAGWTTLSLHSATMFGIMFLILAILAEYLGRVLDEARDRPRYHLLDERNSSVMLADEARRNVVADSVRPVAGKTT